MQSLCVTTADVVPIGLGTEMRKRGSLVSGGNNRRAAVQLSAGVKAPALPKKGSIVGVQNLLCEVVLCQ